MNDTHITSKYVCQCRLPLHAPALLSIFSLSAYLSLQRSVLLFFIALAFICLKCYFILFGSFFSVYVVCWTKFLDFSCNIWYMILGTQTKSNNTHKLRSSHFSSNRNKFVIFWYFELFMTNCRKSERRLFYSRRSVRLINTHKFPLFATWINIWKW